MKKIRKLVRNPNMFFFDMFQKRLMKNAPSRVPSKKSEIKKPSPKVSPPIKSDAKQGLPLALVSSTESKSSSRTEKKKMETNLSIDSATLKDVISAPSGLGFRDYIVNTYDCGCGVEDGCDERSLLLWSGYLMGVLEVLHGIRSALSLDIRLYTLGGGYARNIGFSDSFEFRKVCSELLGKPDFVLEISNSMGHLEVLRIFLFDINDDGLAAVRASKALVKKFPVRQLNEIYFSRKERWPVIDAVYTWVNHVDSGWQNLWNQSFPSEKLDLDRYSANDELRYSLRSLNKYAPWLRKVFVVSNCQRPAWLAENPNVAWVFHEDVFPDRACLPTFNSHSIEACLHNIDGLAENFLYLNDDVVFNQPCLPQDFFDGSGRSISFLEPYGMVSRHLPADGLPDYLVAAKNSKELLAKDYPAYGAHNLHRHVAFALRRSVLRELENSYAEKFAEVRIAKRRSPSDINVVSFLYHHFALQRGAAVRGEINSLIVRPKNIDVLDDKASYKFKVLCFNDGNGSASDMLYKKKTAKYLQEHLGEVAPWERALR